jgi:hypothetical protein
VTAVPATPPAPPSSAVAPPAVAHITPAKRQQRTPSKPSAPIIVTTEGDDSQDGCNSATLPIDEKDGSLAINVIYKEAPAKKRKLVITINFINNLYVYN